MTTPRILAFAGSLRTDSFNKKLARIGAEGARAAGAEVTLIDLRDFPMPVYDGDLEAAGMPETVLQLKKLFLEHQGLLIASPEYNGSIPGPLKNAIDWVSRSAPGERPLASFTDKVAANGLAVDQNGMIIAGAQDKQQLSRVDPVTGEGQGPCGLVGDLGACALRTVEVDRAVLPVELGSRIRGHDGSFLKR
jgi:NAD(P)H-dependent FMN reductase